MSRKKKEAQSPGTPTTFFGQLGAILRGILEEEKLNLEIIKQLTEYMRALDQRIYDLEGRTAELEAKILGEKRPPKYSGVV